MTFANGLRTIANAIVLQSNQKIIVAGTSIINNIDNLIIARYNTNGTLDTTFGTNGITTTAIGSFAYGYSCSIESGQAVVTGQSFNTHNDVTLARYTTSGTLDSTFGTSGIVTTSIGDGGAACASIIQPADQNIVIAGSAVINGIGNGFAARYTTTGALDTTFGSSGLVDISDGSATQAFSVTLQSDNKILIAGVTLVSAINQFFLVRLNTNGSFDTSFGTNGIVSVQVPGSSDDKALAVGLQSSGKIIVTGISNINNIPSISLARFTTSGAIDTTFGNNGFVITQLGLQSKARALVIQSNDSIVVAGDVDNQFCVVRYTSNGTLDNTFGIGGSVLTTIGDVSQINSIVEQSDGKIVATGTSDDNLVIVRYYNNNTNFININSPINSSTITSTPFTISGNASQSNCTVTIIIDSITIGTTTTDNNGNWTFSCPQLANGTHTITAQLSCAASPSLSASNSISVTVSTANTIAIASPVTGGIVRYSSRPTFSGCSSLDAGTIHVTIDGALASPVTTNAVGNWKYATGLLLNNGPHTVHAQNNTASTSTNFFVDIPLQVVAGSVTNTGTIISGTGFTASASGSAITITFNPAFVATPNLIATGQNALGVSTVTISALSNSSASLTFSAGTTAVNFFASAYPS